MAIGSPISNTTRAAILRGGAYRASEHGRRKRADRNAPAQKPDDAAHRSLFSFVRRIPRALESVKLGKHPRHAPVMLYGCRRYPLRLSLSRRKLGRTRRETRV